MCLITGCCSTPPLGTLHNVWSVNCIKFLSAPDGFLVVNIPALVVQMALLGSGGGSCLSRPSGLQPKMLPATSPPQFDTG